MKCPKCSYLGFDTGDRCKNCGYDFSLLSVLDTQADATDYDIHPPAEDDLPVHVLDDLDRSRLEPDHAAVDEADPWIGEDRDDPLRGKTGIEPDARDAIDDSLTLSLAPETPLRNDDLDADLEVVLDDAELSPPLATTPSPSSPVVPFAPFASPAASTQPEEELPLFTPPDEDDQPLVKLPPAPRPPLAVRRTPDTPRLRAVPRPTSRPSPAPVLQFSEELAERPAPVETEPGIERAAVADAPAATVSQTSGPGPRLVALAIDCAILIGIDLGVVYFTLRMAGVSPADWRLLPAAPMLTFLALLKVSYFYAFTAVGGQTIGKMAARIGVVSDSGASVDATRAMRRTVAGLVSLLVLGLGYVPALFGEHRALHDRLAGTRVIRLRT